MLIFSKDSSTMKAKTGKEKMASENLILLTKTTRKSSKELFHQEALHKLILKYLP
jgi:hypothetical protein